MSQQLKMNFTNSEVRSPLNVNLIGSRSLPILKTSNIVNYQQPKTFSSDNIFTQNRNIFSSVKKGKGCGCGK